MRDVSNIKYANKDDILAAIKEKYKVAKEKTPDESSMAGAIYIEDRVHEPRRMSLKEKNRRLPPEKRINEDIPQ